MSTAATSTSSRSTEAPAPITPEVGMGATIILWSDRHAATIVEVRNERTIVVQRDTATALDGGWNPDGSYTQPTYSYEADSSATRETYTLRNSGRWVFKGQADKYGSVVLRVGHRSEYFDPRF